MPRQRGQTKIHGLCPACGRDWQILAPPEVIDPLIAHVAKMAGLTVTDDTLQLTGVCSSCREGPQ
jgi:Fe2+ or Zn2+ uptake regulation protein